MNIVFNNVPLLLRAYFRPRNVPGFSIFVRVMCRVCRAARAITLDQLTFPIFVRVMCRGFRGARAITLGQLPQMKAAIKGRRPNRFSTVDTSPQTPLMTIPKTRKKRRPESSKSASAWESEGEEESGCAEEDHGTRAPSFVFTQEGRAELAGHEDVEYQRDHVYDSSKLGTQQPPRPSIRLLDKNNGEMLAYTRERIREEMKRLKKVTKEHRDTIWTNYRE